MTTSTSSSYERAKSHMRVEASSKRGFGRRSRSVDGSGFNSSEDENNESRSRDRRRSGGKEYGKSSHRERRSSSSHDRSRRRKRSPSPSRPKRTKIRSTSDSPHSRSRSSHYHSHSPCGFTDELLDRLGDWVGPSLRRNDGEDQLVLVKSGTLGTVVNNNASDWLDLSLKAPAKPPLNLEGVSREDLKLCLHSSMLSAPTVSEIIDDAKTGVMLAKLNVEEAPSTSSCKEGFQVSLCSTSFVSVQACLPIFKGSLSARSNPVDGASPRNTIIQKEATSSLKTAKTSSSLGLDRDAGTSGSSQEQGQKTEEEKCFDLLNQLISMTEEKDEMEAGPDIDLPVSGSLKEQSTALAVSDKQQPVETKEGTSPTRAEMSVSVIELSNSLSIEQNDVGAELSCYYKEVTSADCSMLVKEKVGVSTTQNTMATPDEPSTLPQTPSPSKSCKTSLLVAPPSLVVELSDSTTVQEDDDEHGSDIQSHPALASTVWQLNVTSEISEPLPTSNVKDQSPVLSSCPQDISTDRISLLVTSDTAVERSGKDIVQDLSESDHATDLFIEKIQSLLNHARPHSPSLLAMPNLNSSLNVTLAEQSGTKESIRKRDTSCFRRRNVEIVELSDSSPASSSSSDESDTEIALALRTKRCNHIHERELKSLSPSKKIQDSAEMANDHPMQYLNEDVVCCSSKPPLKSGRDASGADQQSRVTYIRDKHGNLLQVVDVDDSDIEEDGEDPDTKSCEGDKEDEFFSSVPQVLPVIEEIKEMLQGESSIFEKSSELYNQSEPSRPPVAKVSTSVRTQISSRPPSKRRKPRKLVLEESNSQESDNNTEAAVRSTAVSSVVGLKQREKWKRGILCDLCSLGPSLSLGEWYCWCCGIAATKCQCPEEKKLRKLLSLGYRKGQKQKKRGTKIIHYQWSGKVHKMCALWSSEVYVKQSPKKEPYFAQLETAVKRGNTLVCKHPDCKKTGATLGCRVRACRRSYHYPCAEKLANQCMVRMWDGVLIPIACQYHRHVEEQAERARERLLRSKITDPVRDGKTVVPAERPYIGKKLLCEDTAQGQEQVQIPCTNDVDDEPAPSIRYITKCWFKGRPVDYLHPVGTELAKGCQGCAGPNFDNPHSLMPFHVMGPDKTNRSRESDDRLDWQGELMYGRLPYNSAGLLQLGPDSKDIVECNSRCKCGPKCKNREIQKGLRCHLELFKTKDRGWGVRTLEQIPRGKFVVEYVGDVLTQTEADERGEKYDQNQLSYLFNLDHPGVPHSDAIVLDGITMSNIARFINHSCEGNLMIFRVFSETNDLRYFRIGMYAIQDIEVGDELSYDYNYALSKDSSEMVDDPTAIRCFCGAQTCRKWLWQGGDSGLKH